jgi:ribosomal protein S12 methylthiotransferase accessory factor YcaO
VTSSSTSSFVETVQVTDVAVISPFPDAGELLLGRVARQYRLRGGGDEPVQLVSGGALGIDQADVRTRSLGEFLERLSGYAFFRGVDPEDVKGCVDAWISPSTYRIGSFGSSGRSVPSEDVAGFRWAVGTTIDGTATAVPVGFRSPRDGYLFPRDTTGHAAHPDVAQSRWRALTEVIERDALMLSWLVPGWPVRRLPAEILPVPYVAAISRLGLVADVFRLGTGGLPPTALVLLHRGDGRELTCGSAVRPTLCTATEVALQEALLLRYATRTTTVAGADEPVSSAQHLVWGFRNGPRVLAWYRAQAAGEAPIASEAGKTDLVDVDAAAVDEFGTPPVYGDVTVPPVRDRGLTVTRCWIPNAVRREMGSVRDTHRWPRIRGELARWDTARKGVHDAPHPFG